MKKITLLFITLISAAAMAQTPDDVFADFYAATGGKEKWEAIGTYTLTRSFVANAPTDYDMEINVNTQTASISRKKTLMKRDFFYVVKGNDGWLKIPMGSMDKNVKYTVKDLSEKEKATMQQEVKDGLLAFVNYKTKGFAATFDGEESINGKPAQKVTLKRSDITINYFFDKSSHLLVKEIYTIAEETETWEHTTYSTANNGLKFASASAYINSKDKKKINVTTKLVIDQPLNAALFSRE